MFRITLSCLLALSNLPLVASDAGVTTRLNSDGMLLDGLSGKNIYKGNAVLSQPNMRIEAEEMSTQQNNAGETTFAHFTGSPVKLEHTDAISGAVSVATAADIQFDQVSGQITLRGAATITQTDPKTAREIILRADQIDLTQKEGQLRQLAATGAPATFEQKQGQELPVRGEAQQVKFDGEREYLTLEGSAKLERGPQRMKHSIIEYDGKTQRTHAPKREGEQIQFELIQEPKKKSDKK